VPIGIRKVGVLYEVEVTPPHGRGVLWSSRVRSVGTISSQNCCGSVAIRPTSATRFTKLIPVGLTVTEAAAWIVKPQARRPDSGPNDRMHSSNDVRREIQESLVNCGTCSYLLLIVVE
jgi:hypothetical protein